MSLEAIKPIKNEHDCDVALAVIDELMGAPSDTAERDRQEILVTLVETYESQHRPIAAPDPISALEHVMEARGLRQKDLALLTGSHSYASEVLNRRRPLTLAMIRTLSAKWGLPADVLGREYELVTTA